MRLAVVPLLVVLSFAACRAPAPPLPPADALHPVAALALERAGADAPFGLLVTFVIPDEDVAAFEDAFLPAIAATWTEPGNDDYELARVAEPGGPTTYVLYERWRSAADLAWHLDSPPVVEMLAVVGPLAEIDVAVLSPLVRP